MLDELFRETKKQADPQKAKLLAGFFKTGKGEYGEGDTFYGLTVPASRLIAKKYLSLSQDDLGKLFGSPVHEERLIALLILVEQYKKADESSKKAIYTFYLSQMHAINNWDLVDLSAPKIVGEYVFHHQAEKKKLLQLVQSSVLWERRIAVLASFAFIYYGESSLTFTLADMLLQDKHDLMQKAVGWMLREIGKRVSHEELVSFLKTRYKKMPRTMLRYAIERFDETERQKYLKGEIE